MNSKTGITATGLKWIAITAMLIDHIAWKVELSIPMYIILHIIGRITMPVMCFLIAEGYHHTRNKRNYAIRLLIFAVISQIPYNYFMTGNPINILSLNVIFTLLLGLITLHIIKSNQKPIIKATITALCMIASLYCDYMIFGILWILAFSLYRDNIKHKTILYCIITATLTLYATITAKPDNQLPQLLIQTGMLLPIPLITMYNGKLKSDNTPKWTANKWIFYTFYPLHMLILGILQKTLS